jgi:hypothetical protein
MQGFLPTIAPEVGGEQRARGILGVGMFDVR